MNEAELLIEYAKSWNNLDISYVENYLADDLVYTSQWVMSSIHGKGEYLDYLKGKFETIKESTNIPVADVGYFKNYQLVKDKPCLVITQGETKVAIIIETRNEKISTIDMVGIPSPYGAILFEMEPK